MLASITHFRDITVYEFKRDVRKYRENDTLVRF